MTKTKALLFGAIILINIFVYFPSFFDSCRGPDHQIFLSEIAHIESLPDLVTQSYSYNRSRQQMTGDKVLFRPLLYLFLAFNRWAFGYDFFWWQLTAFILHLCAQYCLFKVLNLFVAPRWAFATVLLGSLLLLPQELVGRHHISGYLFFQIFGLMAVGQFFQYCQNAEKNKNLFLSSLLWLTLSTFACECALILNGIFILLLWLPLNSIFGRFPRRHKALIFLPITIYGALSTIDFFLRVKNFSLLQDGLTGAVTAGPFDISVFFSNVLNTSQIGFQGFFFPAFTKIKFVGHQYNYDTFAFELKNAPQVFNALLVFFSVVFFVFCVWQAIKEKSPIKSQQDPKTFILGLSMLLFAVGYTGLLCLTRLQLNPDYLRTAPHHFYFIYSFSLLGLALATAPFLPLVEKSHSFMKRFLFIILMSFAVLQGHFLHRLNNDLKNLWEPQRIFLKEIDRFVKNHTTETDFSFMLFKSELVYTHTIYLPGQPPAQKTLVEMFFPKYFSNQNPLYYLVYTKKQGVQPFKTAGQANQFVAEITQKNGKWTQEVYVGTTKVDFQQLQRLLRYSQMMKQQKK